MLKYRKTTSLDTEQIKKWISVDPHHQNISRPDFWVEQKPGIENLAIADEHGTIFYVRAENILRLHVQFAPQSEQTRTAKAINEFAILISDSAKKKNYQEIIFESVFEPLIKFLAKRGFKKSPDEVVLDLR